MKWAVWYIVYIECERVWKYRMFETKEEAWEWYLYMCEPRKYPEDFEDIERPVPFVDGRPQEVYIDRGCKGQISMFDSTFMLELDAELEATI